MLCAFVYYSSLRYASQIGNLSFFSGDAIQCMSGPSRVRVMSAECVCLAEISFIQFSKTFFIFATA